MKFCPDCGTAVAPNAKFCSECGSGTTADGIGEIERGSYKVFTKRYVAILGGILVVGLAGIGIAQGVTSGGGGQKSPAEKLAEKKAAYRACIQDQTPPYEDCSPLWDASFVDSGSPATTTSTSTQQPPKTCLQWQANYSQHWVAGDFYIKGRWEQVQTGQTCVRYG
jgi:predicted nucleic acid-binding Zn ribbon protein